MENTPTHEDLPALKENAKNYLIPKVKLKKILLTTVIIIAILILVSLFTFAKSFVVATVNGAPVSRLKVIKELERQGGKQALEAIITQKIIEDELDNQKVSLDKGVVDGEIEKIKTQITAQGATLDALLKEQGMTEAKLREQITLQKRLEKLLGDKVLVTDTEIDGYIKDSKITPPQDIKTDDFRMQVSEQIKQQKFQQEVQKWISDLKENVNVKYYNNY